MRAVLAAAIWACAVCACALVIIASERGLAHGGGAPVALSAFFPGEAQIRTDGRQPGEPPADTRHDRRNVAAFAFGITWVSLVGAAVLGFAQQQRLADFAERCKKRFGGEARPVVRELRAVEVQHVSRRL